MQKYSFIDFEASSLSAQSWPIEIGVARIVDREIVSSSKLIAPRSEWDLSDWNPKSEEIHGISLDDVMSGDAADDVAKWFLEETQSSVLVSDAPEFDGRWLARLLEGVFPAPAILHFSDIAHAAFSAEGSVAPGRLPKVYKNMTSRRAVHRAEEDARHLALGFRAGLPKN